MINISVSETAVTVEGHAGYAPAGQDIVCAAVSALSGTLVESLYEIASDTVCVSTHDAKLNIAYKGLSERARVLIRSFFIGVKGIETDYPEFIKIAEGSGIDLQ